MIHALFCALAATFKRRGALLAENIALRQQLAALNRTARKPPLGWADRAFWVLLSRIWNNWKQSLLIVKPETVIRWHRQGFRIFWYVKSRKKAGRPRVSREIRDLIRGMAEENPTWGAPRIHSELLLLGYRLAQSTVARYLVRPNRRTGQTWMRFLRNHASHIAAVDLFTVPTASFKVLYALVVIHHSSRRIVHVAATHNPTAVWVENQIVSAFPYDTAPRYLIRDRDTAFGSVFRQRVKDMGIKEVLISYRSPWQNCFAERVTGSIRRECLDHVIVLNPRHLARILGQYKEYYNTVRPHLSLEKNCPFPRSVASPDKGKIVAEPYLGGLHHKYSRAA